jgi:putative zinc finger/helix-turn-helix YgiT family protein
MKTPYPCDECDSGTVETVTEDYTIHSPDGNTIVVPGVEMHRCSQCGETLIPAASSRYITEFQARESEQLTREELHAIFERSNLTQKDFAEALGLGEKTFHRWLKGTQVVSRSMGYYLRSMDLFPEAFDWVKERSWRKPTPRRATAPAVDEPIFPALQHRASILGTSSVSLLRRTNPAEALILQAVQPSSN